MPTVPSAAPLKGRTCLGCHKTFLHGSAQEQHFCASPDCPRAWAEQQTKYLVWCDAHQRWEDVLAYCPQRKVLPGPAQKG